MSSYLTMSGTPSFALNSTMWEMVTDDPTEAPPPSGLFYRLNVQKLSGDLHDLLSGCLAGYSMQLRATDERYLTSNGNRRRCPGKLASTTA